MTRNERQLQDHLATLRAGKPLVRLDDEQATLHAARLRENGMAWSAIAQVMSLYHGQWLTRTGWLRRCERARVTV
jgi:hypothetical protein